MIRVLRDDERLALFTLGRYQGLKGPGIVMVLPIVSMGVRLRLGDVGNLVSSDLALFGHTAIPIAGYDLSGSQVKIVAFDYSEPPSRARVESLEP
jgi:hypothetical protein